MSVFNIKQNDRLPAIQASLVAGNGAAVNLVGSTVTFNMRDSSGASKVSAGACTILDAANGVVSYAWGTTDTNTAGTFTAEFEVTNGGLTETFPNDSNITVVITAELG